MKMLATCLAVLLMASGVMAQDTTPVKTFLDDPVNDPMMPLYALSVMVFVVITLVLIVALYLVHILNMLVLQAQKEEAIKEGKVYVPAPSWWSKISQKLNASVPVSQEQDIDLGHSYDGIRELDNHLPPWWKWLFYGTIGWSAAYLVVYHLSSSLPLQIEEYTIELAEAKEQVDKLKASQPAAVVDENTLVYTADASMIAKGKAVFISTNCQSCHRVDGGGNAIGPNLTDEYWIHGGSIKDIFLTIKDGAIEKGMPAWGKTMSAQDVRDLAFFVMSLQGTNPAESKAPQGERYVPEEKVVVADSAKVQASL